MKRYALCIGNNEYEYLSKLSCAVNDANAIGEKLTALGFDVDIALNLKYDQLCSAITGISDKIQEYDAILLYYAGHGFQINNTNILAPIDFNSMDDPKTVKYRSFPIDDLMALLGKEVKKTKIIILDACRTDLRMRGASHSFGSMTAPQGSIIAFSTSPGQSAREGSEHGLYTDSLLKYISSPRKSIESVFKRVRTDLARKTNGIQIPWEHTSLIGEFYLNPDTIYDGHDYNESAYADSYFVPRKYSKIGTIIEKLKTHNWYEQNEAIKNISDIEFNKASAEELFVLGRNIYQAMCGNSIDSYHFFEHLPNSQIIPAAKKHILNGMLYEIYYNSKGKLRRKFKSDFSIEVINLAETEAFFGSCEFIASKLTREDEHNVFYIPGQNDEKIDVVIKTIKTDDGPTISDIIINEKNYYYERSTGEKIQTDNTYFKESSTNLFELKLLHRMATPKENANIIYEGEEVKDIILVPFYGFDLIPIQKADQ